MRTTLAAAAVALAASLAGTAHADDTLKVAVGQLTTWENQMTLIGQEVGIFKKHGIVLENFGTNGAGETLQAVISGSADIGIGMGTAGAMRAFVRGAPVRMLAPAFTGSNDLYWYVKADSPIKSLADTTASQTIAYSTSGSSTNSLVIGFGKELGAKAKPTATGGPPATLTLVMSGQIDVGWASPPFGLKELEEGKIHIVAKATDATLVRGQTIRVVVANAAYLEKNKAIVERFMQAYRESIDYMYSANPQVIKDYAEFVKVPEPMAKRVRDEFFPKSLVDPDKITGLDSLMQEAVNLKFIPQPLTKAQTDELIQIPPRK